MNEQPQQNQEQGQEQPRPDIDDGREGNEAQRTTPPRIYVASLSDYNAGRLHGAWLDADQDVDELDAGIQAMLADSPEPAAEEWAIHDYDGFEGIALGEYESLATVARLAAGVAEHGEPFAVWANHVGTGYPEELDRFEECYLGTFDTAEDFGQYLCEDMLGVDPDNLEWLPEQLRSYLRLDIEGLVRDMELGGDILTEWGSDGLMVFLVA